MVISEQSKTEIYKDYHGKVFGYIISQVSNSDLAEDLSEDVFLKVYEKLDTFDETKASISTWIYTIARNTLTDYYRTRKVCEEIPEEYESTISVEDEVCNREMLDKLANALEKLDEKLPDSSITSTDFKESSRDDYGIDWEKYIEDTDNTEIKFSSGSYDRDEETSFENFFVNSL